MRLNLEDLPWNVVTFPQSPDVSFDASLQKLRSLLNVNISPQNSDAAFPVWTFEYNGLIAKAYARFGVITINLREAERERLAAQGFRVELNRLLRPAAPSCGSGIIGGTTWGLIEMGIPSAPANLDGTGISVAILDSGLDLNHPDFIGRVAASDCKNFVGADPSSLRDFSGHGTHCAGIIFGKNPSGTPRYSVAPGIRPIIGRVMDSNGDSTDSILIEALNWAADKDANVISLSLGRDRQKDEQTPFDLETVTKKLMAENRLLVAASGNGGPNVAVAVPAACQEVMAIAAVDAGWHLTDTCSRTLDTIGKTDVSAPGDDVCSAFVGGGYFGSSGTSAATAHVAGLAALYWQRHLQLQPPPNPTRIAKDIWDLIVAKAQPLKATGSGVNPQDFGSGFAKLAP